jgi:CubicO group peptidase (beta-lactamase class C family)
MFLFSSDAMTDAKDTSIEVRREQYGVQLIRPEDGFVLRKGQVLPPLVWEHPDSVEALTEDPTIQTRWFDEDLEPSTKAEQPGRYYAYGESKGPGGSVYRRAMTCVCVADDFDLSAFAEQTGPNSMLEGGYPHASKDVVSDWVNTEIGAIRLAGLIDSNGKDEPRMGQWYMENATRHVRLKRKVLGHTKPVLHVAARAVGGAPAPVLRSGSRVEAGVTEQQVQVVEAKLDRWYAAAQKPTAIVIARNGVIVLAKSYGEIDDQPATIHTPMLLHSAMKPLMGIQLGMYIDRGLVKLDEPLGNHLAEFDTEADRLLTFRAGHVHATGIDLPWPLAFSRLFYFRPWQETLISHRKRQWAPGDRHKYGVVGIILSVRSLELLSGRNYWDAMEQEVFEPLGIRDMLPGGVGFSAENLARIGVLLDNHGKYGEWELFSEETYEQIIPTQLSDYFPEIDEIYGIGLQDHESYLGPGSYGHGGGCGTLLSVHPEKNLVFAMVRNDQGEDYKRHRAELMALLKGWIEE